VIHDFSAPVVLDLPRHPIVVVGSGAAGIPLSLELADRGHPVVLLESGGDVSDRNAMAESAFLNSGAVDGQSFTGLEMGRARVLGGTTEQWKGQCMRLLDSDLLERHWVPNSGWPIAPKELEGPYAAAERWLDVSGKGYDERRWAEFPKLPPLAWNPDRLESTFTEIARHPYLGTRHRERMARHRNLRVVVHATVSRVRMEAGRLRGVEVVSVHGRRLPIDADTVVLAAGTVENARLLQLSDPDGVGVGEGREHTGRFLQDHPIIRTAEVLPYDHRPLQDRYVLLRHRGRRLWPKVRLSVQAQERHELLGAAAVFKHEHDRAALDAAHRLLQAIKERRLSAHVLPDAAHTAAATPALVRALSRRLVGRLPSAGDRPAHVWLEVWLEQAPKASRRVTLATSRDALGLPQATVMWSCEPEEIEASRRLTRWIAQDLDRLGIARVQDLPAMTDDSAWLGTVRDGFHPAGTTRMSDTAATGVVDPNLRVHGVEGLYVVGGSVFPTSGYANPTLTIVALTLRLAEHLHDVRTARAAR
jgi:choline dehydrogenase-like flavoprotein